MFAGTKKNDEESIVIKLDMFAHAPMTSCIVNVRVVASKEAMGVDKASSLFAHTLWEQLCVGNRLAGIHNIYVYWTRKMNES